MLRKLLILAAVVRGTPLHNSGSVTPVDFTLGARFQFTLSCVMTAAIDSFSVVSCHVRVFAVQGRKVSQNLSL